MIQARTLMIALAGAAGLGSAVSMAVPTRMAISAPTIGGHAIAGPAGDELAYYSEPGPQDLDPTAYYPGSWTSDPSTPASARWLAARASGYPPARDVPEAAEPVEPEMLQNVVSPAPDAIVSTDDQPSTVTVVSGNADGAVDSSMREHIAVIDVPAPQ
ncbi:hypothetical protein ACFSTD_23265 [Novosphingobium colocasiae]|uniref:Uncharacterized protein n=1 Tax=Novosphingobium colocasiae TaxID=1256513 RepID=A0A918UG69_9SPHN|nr:hypothetical protein [Novosphingobium colocasiae]GGZ07314.1 hypothetical protein GCM10011614_22790 [Novosphingobium colocasiae]